MTDSMPFTLPDFSSSRWGPPSSAIPSFSGLPFTPFSKRDNINYIADWDTSKNTAAHNRNRARKEGRNKFGGEDANLLGVLDENIADDDDGGFVLKQKTKYETTKKWRKDRTKQAAKVNYSQGIKQVQEQKKLRAAPKTQTRKKKIKQKRARRRRYVENPRPLVPSIKKQDHWIDVKDIWFRDTFEIQNNFIFKIDGFEEQTIPIPRSKKLILAGSLHGVLTKYDSTGSNWDRIDFEKYSRNKFLSFKYKPATSDPNIIDLALKKDLVDPKKHCIYTTDNVLTTIMCCPRSKYSFDIVINKIGNKIFLDERSKVLSGFSVDETSQYRPTQKGTSRINSYQSLNQEATYINAVFSEQMVFHQNKEFSQTFKRKIPFLNEINSQNNKKNKKRSGLHSQRQAGSQALIYNLYDLTDNISIVARCSVDGFVANKQNPNSKTKDWAIIRALNQYDSTKSKTIPWNKSLRTRESSILAQEITNNNFKCARWGMNAHLADAKYIKLGFVVRENLHSTEKHLICGVKTYETKDFIKNKLKIRSIGTVWTVLAKFIKCILELDGDGRFIALRDPLKQVIRVYKVTDDSFTKEDGLSSLGYLKKIMKYDPDENNNKTDKNDNENDK